MRINNKTVNRLNNKQKIEQLIKLTTKLINNTIRTVADEVKNV